MLKKILLISSVVLLIGIAAVLFIKLAPKNKQPESLKKAEEVLSNKGETKGLGLDEKVTQAEVDKFSEALGNTLIKNIKKTFDSSLFKVNLDRFTKGVKEGSAGKEALMGDDEIEQMTLKLQDISLKELSDKNLKMAEDYIKNHASEPGMIEVEKDKLYYKVLEEGKGDALLSEGKIPFIHYTGKDLEGNVFGSTKDEEPSMKLPLDYTIPGLKNGLMGMKEGEKRLLLIHPSLGFQDKGFFAPNSLLIFEVKLDRIGTETPSTPEQTANSALPKNSDNKGPEQKTAEPKKEESKASSSNATEDEYNDDEGDDELIEILPEEDLTPSAKAPQKS